MSDSDLLRRGDVKAVVREAFSHKPHPHLDLRYQEALAAIDAVPAAADGRWEIEINRLIASVALSASLANRLTEQLATDGLTEYQQTWKQRDTPLGRAFWEHTASGHRISASEFTGWPTPSTTEHQPKTVRGNLKLNGAARLVGWPTTTRNDSLRHPAIDSDPKNVTLNHAVQMVGWGTPRSVHSGHTTGNHLRATDGRSRMEDQSFIVASTATAAEFQLNPAHSRWLEGYPATWDNASPNFDHWQKVQERIASAACEDTGTPSSPK